MNQTHLHPDVLQTLRQSFNNERHLSNLLSCLTSPPMFTTLRFDPNLVDGESALKDLSACLEKQCQKMQREKYDMFLHPLLPDCIMIKNRGPHCLVKHHTEVIVDLACGMAVLRGAHVYKQGIMGSPHCLRAGDVVSVYADLDGKCLKGFAANYGGKKLFVGNGIAQVSRLDLFNTNSIQKYGC